MLFYFIFCHHQNHVFLALHFPFTSVLNLSRLLVLTHLLRPPLSHQGLLTSLRIPLAFTATTIHIAGFSYHSLGVHSAFLVASQGLESFAHDSALLCSKHGAKCINAFLIGRHPPSLRFCLRTEAA